MRQKLNLITLGVKDLATSVDFYEKGLGWKKSQASTDAIVFFNLGGIILSLYPRPLLAEDATVPDAPTGFPGMTVSFNAHDESEVDAVMKQAHSAGATIVKPAQKVFWGGYSGYFQDPNGHLIEVSYNPFWKFDEKDNIILPE